MGCAQSTPAVEEAPQGAADKPSQKPSATENPNCARAKSTFDLQSKMAVGEVDPALMAKFGAEFMSHYAAEITFQLHPKAEKMTTDFGGMMGAAGGYWMGLVNTEVNNGKVYAEGASVVVEQTYVHSLYDNHKVQVPGTAKTLLVKQRMEYNADGLITAWSSEFDPDVIAASRALQEEANKACYEKNLAAHQAGMVAWGSGGFAGPDKDELAKKHWAEGIVFDVRFPMKNDQAYTKTYNGFSGAFEWLDYLGATWDFPDFNMAHTAEGPGGAVWAKCEFTPTLKSSGAALGHKIAFINCVDYDVEGRIVKSVFYWGPETAGMDALYVDGPTAAPLDIPAADADAQANMGVWGATMAAWGSGALDGPDKEAKAAELYTADTVVDASYPMANSDKYTKYTGMAGLFGWLEFLNSTWTFPDFAVDHACPGPDGKVWAMCSSHPVYKPSGTATASKQPFIMETTVTGGKISAIVFYWGPDTPELDALLSA